ncbi:MAG: large protein [Acidobacteria bacterium]|nr:large protein [Acidobacteriota bacterium]
MRTLSKWLAIALFVLSAPLLRADTTDFEAFPTGTKNPRFELMTMSGGLVARNAFVYQGDPTATYMTYTGCASVGCTDTVTMTFDKPVSDLQFILIHNDTQGWFHLWDDKGNAALINLQNCPICAPIQFLNPALIKWPVSGIKSLSIGGGYLFGTGGSNAWYFGVDNVTYTPPPPQGGLVVRLGDSPDDPNPPAPMGIPDSGKLNVRVPLGRSFSIRYKKRLPNGTWQDAPADFVLGTAAVQPISFDANRTLFPAYSSFLYNNDFNAATRLLQSVHLGSVPLTITPDPSLPPVTVTVTTVNPSTLGTGTNASAIWDPRFITQAHNRGIPPQYLKAVANHESGGTYGRRTWRYEPGADRDDVVPVRGVAPTSDYVLPTATDDGNFPLGRWLCPPSVRPACGFGDIDDLSPKTSLSYLRNGVNRSIPGLDVNQLITIREICNGTQTPRQNWPCGTSTPPAVPGSASMRRRPSTPPDSFGHVANPHMASSYGMFQVTWYSVVDPIVEGPIWGGATPSGGSGFRKNPALLFDDDANIARGSASVVTGPAELRNYFRLMNGTALATVPSFDDPSDFTEAIRRMLQRYNGSSTYPPLVLRLVPQFVGALPASTSIISQSLDCSSVPLIYGDPSDTAIVPGGMATLAVSASDVDTYQWFAGAVGDTSNPVSSGDMSYVLVSPAATNPYWVRMSNACGSTTASATVTVASGCAAPSITSDSGDRTVPQGTQVTLSVNAAASSYQWFAEPDGGAPAAINGATTSSVNVSPQVDTTYYAMVGNGCSSIRSRLIRTTVTSCSAPAITTQPSGSTISSGSAPLSLVASGTAPLTITWKTAAGVTVGTGASISVSPTATTSYYAVVSNACGSAQSATVAVTVSATCVAPAITAQPVGSAINWGDSTPLSLVASGTLPLTVTWKTAAGVTVGSGNSISVNPTATTSYYATVTNGCGSVTSATVTVTVNCAPRITVQPVSVSITAGTSTTLSVTAVGPGPITVNWYTAAGVLSATGASLNVAPTTTMSGYAIVSNSCGSVQSNTITVTVNPACVAPQITAQPAGSSIVSGAAASLTLTATGDAPLTITWRTAAGTQVGSGTTFSVSPTQTTSYYATVSNACGSVQSTTVSVAVCHPPVITTQPASVNLAAGQQATLSVAATGDGLTYQWYARDPSPGSFVALPGATGATLAITPVNPTADYYVRVSGSCGTVNSNIVTVTRPADCIPPSISSQPQPVSVNAGQTATLSAAGSGSDPFTYQWMESTDGNHYSQASWGTGPTLYTTPIMTSYYYCMMSNGCGTDVTNVVTVTVNGCIAPSVTTNPQSTSVQANHTTTLTAFGYGGQTNLQVWYTWYSSTDGVHFSEELWGNGTSLQVTPSVTTYYFCRIGNYCTTVDTSVAAVTVTP